MKHQFGKRLLSAVLVGLLVLTSIPASAAAAETGTVAGNPETIRVSSGIAMNVRNCNGQWIRNARN